MTIQGPFNADLHQAQALRLQRFAMAVTTYALVIPAAALISSIGFGGMSRIQRIAFSCGGKAPAVAVCGFDAVRVLGPGGSTDSIDEREKT